MRVSEDLPHLTSRYCCTKTQTCRVEISSQFSNGAELKNSLWRNNSYDR